MTQSQKTKPSFLNRFTSIVTRLFQRKRLDSLLGTLGVPEADALSKGSLGLEETSPAQLIDKQDSTTAEFIRRSLETPTTIAGVSAEEDATAEPLNWTKGIRLLG
jgi:hypothetical protein